MKILVSSIIVAVLAFSLFSFSFLQQLQQVYAQEEEEVDESQSFDDGTSYEEDSDQVEDYESEPELEPEPETSYPEEDDDNGNANNDYLPNYDDDNDNGSCSIEDCTTTGFPIDGNNNDDNNNNDKADVVSNCDDSYPDVCIESPPPDLDCDDVGDNIKVTGSDPHDLDRDGDGVGCEKSGSQNPKGKDVSETKNNDPCNYYGQDVCDKNRNGCDSKNFDCLSDFGDGNDWCTTGMCPGDDKPALSDGKNKNNVGKDISETNPKVNDPCNYYGQNVCDKSKKGCDDKRFHCEDNFRNGDWCTTGMCPGDDKPYLSDGKDEDKDKNKKKSSGSSDNNNGKDRDDNNNPILKALNKIFDSNKDSNTNVKKFEVKVILDNVTTAESDTFRMRVIVYGPHTLNKPTLDKPGQLVNVQGCGHSCYTDWGFTALKVPIGSEIQACVWNSETGQQNCGYGKSHSTYGPEIIRVSLPSLS